MEASVSSGIRETCGCRPRVARPCHFCLGESGVALPVSLGVLFVVGALAGCTPAPLTKADVDGKIVCNSDRMDQVERAARKGNWHVQWVNCPPAVLRAV